MVMRVLGFLDSTGASWRSPRRQRDVEDAEAFRELRNQAIGADGSDYVIPRAVRQAGITVADGIPPTARAGGMTSSTPGALSS